MGFIKKVVGGVGKVVKGIGKGVASIFTGGRSRRSQPSVPQPQQTSRPSSPVIDMPRIPIEGGAIGFTQSTRHMGPYGISRSLERAISFPSTGGFGGMGQGGMGGMGGIGGISQSAMMSALSTPSAPMSLSPNGGQSFYGGASNSMLDRMRMMRQGMGAYSGRIAPSLMSMGYSGIRRGPFGM